MHFTCFLFIDYQANFSCVTRSKMSCNLNFRELIGSVLSHKKFLTNNSVLLPQRATHEKSGVGGGVE